MEKEIWRAVVGYEGLYEVSNFGNVRRVGRKNLSLVPYNGYHIVSLCKDGVIHNYTVHRLVAIAFLPNPNNLPQVDHIIPVKNGGSDSVDNLRWVSSKENANNEMSIKNRSEAQLSVSGKKSKSMLGKNKKKLLKYDSEWNLIGIFNEGIRKYCKTNGLNYVSICDAISKKKKLYGHYWASAIQ